jgi:hypothetical protein
MPYWINSTLAALPSVMWVYVGLGLPWALALLPRKDWRDRVLVACLALAFGPALLTAWMFVLGTIGGAQALLRFDLIVGGTVVLAAAGALLAWRVYSISPPTQAVEGAAPLAIDEKLLIALIVIAVAIRWLTTAHWPFTAYDELWVYGYEGRLYTLLGYIPQRIGYYPQFLPLQYTYAQLAVGGVDDHAARAVIPFLHAGSILAVYALGARLFNRRAGIVAAALWALYPHVGEWAHVGDLEIAQTFLLTATAAFFFMAWTGQEPRRRYALIAGLLFGAALWTKPTAGAFVWGIILLAAMEIVRVGTSMPGRGVELNVQTQPLSSRPEWWRACRPRLEVAFITGLACIPLGGVWYARNILLGHPPVVLPIASWLALAQRSGAEFGWPLLAALLLVGRVYLIPRLHTLERESGNPAAQGASDLVGMWRAVFTPQNAGRNWLLGGLGLVWGHCRRFAPHRMDLEGRRSRPGVILYWRCANMPASAGRTTRTMQPGWLDERSPAV